MLWAIIFFAARLCELTDIIDFRLGGDLRFDNINQLDLYQTTRRIRRVPTRQDVVDWLSVGGFTEVGLRPTDRLKITGGLRLDYYEFDVDARRPEYSGSDNDITILPSKSLAYAVNDYVELYANWRRGFHSNSSRTIFEGAAHFASLRSDVPRVNLT